MRQRDDIEVPPVEADRELFPDDFIHPGAGHEALDGEPAHGDDQVGFEQEDFLPEPLGTVFDLGGIRDPVAAGRIAPWKTTANGRHVNMATEHRLIDSGPLLEPTEEALPGGPRKRASEDRLAHAGRLADKQHPAHDGPAGNGRWIHLRTEPAGQ
jgi:hypothetical protein